MKVKSATVTALVLIIAFAACIPASANSAQTYWQGVSASGAIITDEECPIIVEHELLTFDLQDFPPKYYNSETHNYNGKVTAKYTFKNPADYKVTATLAFPFGAYPSYIPDDHYNPEFAQPENENFSDTDKYAITVNGEEIEKELRHTYIASNYSNSDLNKISDTYITDSFYRPDLTVTKYSYKAQGITKENGSAYASFPLNADASKTKTLMQPNSGYDYHDGAATAGTWVDNGTEIAIYAIGEPYKAAPVFTVYVSGAEEAVADGEIALISTETLTYEELVFTYYDETRGISRVDWYNAIVDMQRSVNIESGMLLEGSSMLTLSRDSLMRWYIYEITLEPGETLINEVTVPIYPDIDEDYEPPVYSYTYLLSPAKTWKSFGGIDVVFNTPYYMIESNTEETAKTEVGYTLSLDGLPDGELEFTLCASENPEKISRGYFLPVEMIISFSIIAAVIAVIIIAVILIRKKIKRKKEN